MATTFAAGGRAVATVVCTGVFVGLTGLIGAALGLILGRVVDLSRCQWAAG